MGLYNPKGHFDGLICDGLNYRGAYTRGNNKIINFIQFSNINFFFVM